MDYFRDVFDKDEMVSLITRLLYMSFNVFFFSLPFIFIILQVRVIIPFIFNFV